MSLSLPLRANLDWLKKLSKERLAELRKTEPSTTLSLAQLAVAREYGFTSWRAMKAEIDRRRAAIDAMADAVAADAAPIATDDPDLITMMDAITRGDAAVVVSLLKTRPGLVKGRNVEGQTPLHLAAENNDAQVGALLYASGADPDATMGDSGHTALSWAVTCNAGDFARALVTLGARPDLFCAAGLGVVDAVRAWFDEIGSLKSGASRTGSSRYDDAGARLPCPPETARDQISDALYVACRNGNVEVVRELLAHNPDLTFRGYDGGTALHWAYFSGVRDVVEMLIAAGADQARDDNPLRAAPRAFGICTAAGWGFGWLVKKLLKIDPSLIDARTAHNRSATDIARAAGHEELALELEALRT